MIPQIMAQIEANPGTRIEGLGGSFSRNVRLGEDGLGMRWNTPGETFHLAAVLEDAKGAGTSIAPGSFEAIYVKVRLPGAANDYKITRINPDSSVNTVFGLSIDGNFPQYHDLGQSHIESYLDEGNQTINIGEPNKYGDVVEEVVLKKWGHFSSFSAQEASIIENPDYKPLNPNMLRFVPASDIEDTFNKYKSEANKYSL